MISIWSYVDIDCTLRASTQFNFGRHAKRVLRFVDHSITVNSSVVMDGWVYLSAKISFCESGIAAAKLVETLVEGVPCSMLDNENVNVEATIQWVK